MLTNSTTVGPDFTQATIAADMSANLKKNLVTSLLPQHHRFKNLADLQEYALKETGSSKLDTFLLPSVQQFAADKALKKLSNNKKGQAKDEFDHMINWKRVFEQIWQQIRWLISFAQINELALKKIMKKFIKNHFAIKENTINAKLTSIIEE